MVKNRNLLEIELSKICMKIVINRKLCKNIYTYAKVNYDIPRDIISDLVCFRVSMSEASEYILFCLLDSIKKYVKCKIKASDYYTDDEIRKYLSTKYKIDKLKFPIKLKMIQVENDQWIGSVDVSFLMKLRAAQIIYYNENAQRTMEHIIRGGKDIYKITLNQSAVKSIKNNLENNSFISNTLTFNIPAERMSDFYYNESTNELVIKSLDHFDIIDGYHRYIAACKVSDEKSNFNYKFELRIVNFTEDKAKKFIYQEDQKTKMKKLDSNSFDMNNPANIVVDRLNESSKCNLQGLIGRNSGLINFGELSEFIKYFYFKNSTKNEKIQIISLVKELTEKFNALTEYNEKFLTKKYTYRNLAIIMYMFNAYDENNIDEMCEVIDNMIKNEDKIDSRKLYNKTPRKTMFAEVERLYKEVI